jgi:hypothetical protein
MAELNPPAGTGREPGHGGEPTPGPHPSTDPHASAGPHAGTVPQAVADLLASFGPYQRSLQRVIELLSEGAHSLAGLIQATGLSRRTVEEVLAAAATDIEASDGMYSLRRHAVPAYRVLVTTPPRPPANAEAVIARLLAQAPAPKERLDHVRVTPATALRRATWLNETYELSRLLCVGDHDLTALAACLVNPALIAHVADIDEDLLAYVDGRARVLDLNVRCSFADFRFGVPRDILGWADLVFTDPPYTPEGIALFAASGLAALRNREFGNLLVCYGAGERHPGLAWKVQQALTSGLSLAFEQIIPSFSTYSGAQAIGSSSDLYVCRPTSRTWKQFRQGTPSPARVYTRGPQSVEASAQVPPDDVQRAVLEFAARMPGGVAGIVAEGWQAGAGGQNHSGNPGRGAGHAHLHTLLTAGLPTSWSRTGAVVIDLSADPGPWLARSLLAVNAPAAVGLITNSHPDAATGPAQTALADLLAGKYRLRFHRSFAGAAYAVVEATTVRPATPAARLRCAVLEHAHGNVMNSWREAIIALASERGQGMTKNAARAIIDSKVGQRRWWPTRLIDMPRHQIAELLALIDESAPA